MDSMLESSPKKNWKLVAFYELALNVTSPEPSALMVAVASRFVGGNCTAGSVLHPRRKKDKIRVNKLLVIFISISLEFIHF